MSSAALSQFHRIDGPPQGDDEIVNSDESRWALMKSRAITIDGDRVAYRVAGKGPLLLLVHGMAGNSLTWRYVMPALAKQFRVLAPDLLGQGQSDKPRGEYSLGAHANTLRDLLDALGHKRATVIGQSLGGGVAMQFAYQFPELCERLVLVDSGGLGREVTLYLRMLTVPGFEYVFPFFCTPRLRDARNLVATWLSRAGFQSTPASREIWRSYASLADADSRQAFFRSLRDVVDLSGQAVSALSRLYRAAQLPTLIVWGAQDPFIPARHAVAAHKAIPGSRLEIFDGVGHYPHCEAPERFIAVLLDFIASTKAPRRSARSVATRRTPKNR
jgi:pimeloyl-ACP methyl ester carboxylesterase